MLKEDRDAIVRCLQETPHILFAMLYGSAAEGDTFRDVDIALFVDRGALPQEQDLDFGFDVAAALEKVVPYPVDVRVINDAPLIFRYNVSNGVRLVVNDEESYFHFLERTWDDYFDFEPIAMQYVRDMR